MISLFNNDCKEILKTLPDKSVDLVVTDPPYEVSASGGGGICNNVMHLNKSLKSLSDLEIDNGYDFESINNELVRVMKNINAYFWCNKIQIPKYFDFYVNKLGCKFDILRWEKTNPLPTYSNKYLTDTEFCLYFRKGGYCQPQSYEDAKTYFVAPINAKDKKLWKHPTIKPIEIIERLVKNSSKENDTILDCFMGSGTTGVACKELNRNFIGIEINKEYFDIAKERIDNTECQIKSNSYLEQLELF